MTASARTWHTTIGVLAAGYTGGECAGVCSASTYVHVRVCVCAWVCVCACVCECMRACVRCTRTRVCIAFVMKTIMFIFVLELPQPAFAPPAPHGVRALVNDANNDTCISLSQTDMYTFSSIDRSWTPQPRTKCWLNGLVIKKRVPDKMKSHFSVVITGRRLVCSNLRLSVMFTRIANPSCEMSGHYRPCKINEATQSGDLTTCSAKCMCEGEDCKHVMIHIPSKQDDWEMCEIAVH